MLEIRPLQDISEKSSACSLSGIPFDPEYLYYGAFADGQAVAVCSFEIKEAHAQILYLKSNESFTQNTDVLVILGRAVLNFLHLCGMHSVIYLHAEDSLAKKIGFTFQNGVYSANTKYLFSKMCDKK